MAEYTVQLLKKASRLNLTGGNADAHVIAWANETSPRRMRSMDGPQYLRMKNEYTMATLPSFYRRQEAGLQHWEIYACGCDCQCGDCDGLEYTCGECDCDERRLLGKIPRKLTAGHLIDAGDDPMALTETLLGNDCMSMSISDFRTLQMAIMSILRTGEIPLEGDTPAATA